MNNEEKELKELAKYSPHEAMRRAENSDKIDLDTWKEICKAVEDCEKGTTIGW